MVARRKASVLDSVAKFAISIFTNNVCFHKSHQFPTNSSPTPPSNSSQPLQKPATNTANDSATRVESRSTASCTIARNRAWTEEEEEEEEVEFNLHKKVQQKCFWCNKKSIKHNDHSNGWSYISKCRKYHVHVSCIKAMILDEWDKKRDTIKYNNVQKGNSKTLLLQNVNFKQIQAPGNGNKYLRIIKIFIQTIVSIVLGDPTMLLPSLLLELLG